MAATRRLVRRAMYDVLRAVDGFNPTLAAIAPDYGVSPFAVDFSTGSKNLFFGFLPPGRVELSGIAEYPALVLYTTEAENQHINRPLTFSGQIIGNIDIYLQFHEGAEQFDTESVCEAAEEAISLCFERDTAPWPPGLTYVNFFSSPGPITMIDDGWERVIPMQFRFQVDV